LALREDGATIIFSTQLESVEELCDHIAFHKSNKLIEGKLDEVKDNLKPIVLKWAFYRIM
jgi:ABC-type uncharacterized transport system ATPase subunit